MVETFLDTAGLKAIVLVGFLFGVTVLSAVYGVRHVEGVWAGAFLVAALAVALTFERAFLVDRVDVVGVVVLAIAAGYTALEHLGVNQDVWFPVASAGLLAVAISIEAWRWLDDPDVLEFFNRVDIVGLYGVILLLVYSLLLAGGQLDFIYSPYFPAVLFVFVATVLVSSVSYLSGGSVTPEKGELHERLISVVRGLESLDSQTREPLVNHVKAVANAINGVQLPSKVRDDQGPVPVVLPVDGPREKLPPGMERAATHLNRKRFTGYLVDDDGDVVLFKNGRPSKYYDREADEYGVGDGVEDLPDSLSLGMAYAYKAPYSLVDAVEDVTPVASPGSTDLHPGDRRSGDGVDDAVATEETVEPDSSPEPGEAEADTSRPPEQVQKPSEQGSGALPTEEVAEGAGETGATSTAEAATDESGSGSEPSVAERVDSAFESFERGGDDQAEEVGEAGGPGAEGTVEPSAGSPSSKGEAVGDTSAVTSEDAEPPEETAESTGEGAEPSTEPGEDGEGGDADEPTLDVGGEEINVQEMVDLADEVMEDLEDL